MCFNEIPSHVFVRVLDNLLFNFQRPIAARRTFGVPATFPLYHAFLPLSIPFLYFFQSFFGFFIGFFRVAAPQRARPLFWVPRQYIIFAPLCQDLFKKNLRFSSIFIDFLRILQKEGCGQAFFLLFYI